MPTGRGYELGESKTCPCHQKTPELLAIDVGHLCVACSLSVPCHDIEIHGLVWVLKASPCDPWNFEDLGRVTLPDGHQVESSTCANWKCQCSNSNAATSFRCQFMQSSWFSAIPMVSTHLKCLLYQSHCAEGLWSESTRVTLPRGSLQSSAYWLTLNSWIFLLPLKNEIPPGCMHF